MKNLISIIIPVIEQMDDGHIKNQLLLHFPKQAIQFRTIENSFVSLTTSQQQSEVLSHFFHSWSQTNNSAVTVAGLSNRMTMLIHKNKPIVSEYDLFRAVASLNRIVDEDLAVVGRVLHAKLFYNMATSISGSDAWLSKKFLCEEAKNFKDWKDYNSLRNKDIMIGLLTTLVHEIYTHGEVEFILPKFQQWLQTTTDFSEKEIDVALAWIAVHCGPTEKDHFFHAVNAVASYAKAQQIDITNYDLEEIISNYLHYKSKVMHVLEQQLQQDILAS